MKKVFVLLFSMATIQLQAQFFLKETLFEESFANNSNGWPIRKLSEYPFESFINDSGKFVCHLPAESSVYGDMVQIALPSPATTALNIERSIEISFDWEVTEPGGNFDFGFLFDRHFSASNCDGPDYRVLMLSGNKRNIQTSLLLTESCNSLRKVYATGDSVARQSTNTFKLKKENLSWSIFINDKQVLNFQYAGNLNLESLFYGKGTYAFDNLSVNKNKFEYTARPAPGLSNDPDSQPNDSPQTKDDPKPKGESKDPRNNNYPKGTSPSVETYRAPKIWILIAAVEDYRFGPKKLQYTVDDALAMYQFWTSSTGGKIPKEQMVLLTDSTARVENILAKADQLFKKAHSNDIIIAFLSGHGSTGTFITFNGDMSYDYLNKVMLGSKAKRKICIIDACHSGSVAKSVNMSGGEVMTEAEALELFYEAIQYSGDGITYMLSCKANQLSQENKELKHGVFTYYMLQGIKGAADTDKNKLVTLEEAYDYVKTKVPLTSSKQNPTIKGIYNPDTPVSIVATISSKKAVSKTK